MADSKITALTSIGASTDPANDPLVLVDVSDTSMAATGTTKKVTLNQLLGASGTATLASATITGDLTVNSNVNVGASPAFYGGKIATNGSIAIAGGNYLKLWNSTGTGVAGINAGAADTLTFSLTNAFTTAMTLNSTGLGVGGSPTAKISCAGYSSANQLADINIVRSSSGTAIQTGPNIVFTDGTSNNTVTLQNSQGRFGIWNYGAGAWNERLSVDTSGNVGIGITSPSYLLHTSVPTGGDRNMVRFQVSGASSGLTITWNNGTQKMRVNFGDLPTSSAGLPANTLWVDTAAGNTLKLA